MSDAYAVLTGAEWVLRAVGDLGGREAVYGAQCTTCRETSGQGADVARSVGAWAVEHTRANPNHRNYVSVVRTQWRVDPDIRISQPASSPVPVHTGQPRPGDAETTGTGPDQPQRRSARHAAARSQQRRWVPAWVTRAMAFVGWLAGPLCMTGLCTALGVVLTSVFFLGKG
ncbi:DUF7848 domain-containing protein [Streptomyces odontomachi]|uniref:DUF7848 domain-containing protein n=1 Tax=Streptomyces odontomachi TaxID=2944940 RepID=UPI00403E7BB5